jgi:cephalosporin hydroxylase
VTWPLTPLCELSRKYGCEKGGQEHPFHTTRYDSNPCHEYTPVYWDLFGYWTSEVRHVLEIGINEGRSLRMWRDFFPNAQIHGLDIRYETMIYEDRITSQQCDQNDPTSFKLALKKLGNKKYDIIIEDGSHIYDHQVATLKVLFPSYLAPHGVLVIEDANNNTPPLRKEDIPGNYIRQTYTWENAPNDMLQVIRQYRYYPPLPFKRLLQIETDWRST